MSQFPTLFSAFQLGHLHLKNRLFVPGHGTRHVHDFQIGDELIAYHEARARGGVGLIMTEVCSVHHTYDPPNRVSLTADKYIAGLKRLSDMCHRYDCALMTQLFHPGRVPAQSVDGSRPVAFAPSEIMDERYRYQPYPMPVALIEEFIEAFAQAGRRTCEAGADGVEVVASMGYLVSQFLNPRVNRRTDAYGGSLHGRLKFLRDMLRALRRETTDSFVIGIRISADEMDHEGLRPDEVGRFCEELERDGVVDFVNVIAGTVSSVAGWTHAVPPMFVEPGYLAPHARALKDKLSLPVFVAGRINQPQIAEQILARGDADLCGMVRANICDPEFTNKAREGRAQDIRACIACNQACIGHGAGEFGISCIQRPETGREKLYGALLPATKKRRVLVIGGGPAGMKAAAVAAQRGHDVTLHEQNKQLGGQALLAQLLPGRAEFGGIVTNLSHECHLAGVDIQTNSRISADFLTASDAEVVVLATGAAQSTMSINGAEEAHVVDAWSVVADEANVGASVVIADWRCDWIGLGLAEKLARAGCRVRLAANGTVPGEAIHYITRDMWIGALHKLGVEMIPFVRLFGVDAESAYLQHTISAEAVILEDVDTVVTVLPNSRVATLDEALRDSGLETHLIGDCLSPRTAEEAVLEGLKVAAAL